MKIFYAVQATGNGHISRAKQILPYLSKYGQVDVFLSGSNATLIPDYNTKFNSGGISIFYSKCGGINYLKTIIKIKPISIYREAKQLPVEKYDLIINDFESITSIACSLKKVKSVHFGHQASFQSPQTPRPAIKNIAAEWILKNYAKADINIGLHFKRYDDFILPAVIKEEILSATPIDHGHITTYLPAYENECLKNIFLKIPNKIHWFLNGIKEPYTHENITYYPIQQSFFNESLIHCHGLLTGGGFETPAEAIYLNKKLICVPIKGQYEQSCNAIAAKELGATIQFNKIDESFENKLLDWLESPNHNNQKLEANNIKSTIEYILNHGTR